MEGEKFKLPFYPKRGMQDKNGESPIMERINTEHSMVQFSCKYSYAPRLWDGRKNRLLGKSAEAVSVNKELNHLQVNIHKVHESLLNKSDTPIMAERVRELVLRLNSESQGLLHHTNEYVDRFRECVGMDRNERRLKRLLLFHRYLTNFVRYCCRVKDIPVQKTDIAFIKNLGDHFAKEEGFKLDTSVGYLSMLASLFRGLHKRYIADIYPFINHFIRWEVDTPHYTTRGEVGLIVALGEDKLQGHEGVSRDMFLSFCLTGFSYADVCHLTEQYAFHEAGMTWMRKPRMKTGNVCHIPLLPEATATIERYRGIHTGAFQHEPPRGYLLSIPGYDTVNTHLKRVARLCDIQKTLIYYMARHTFVSQMTLPEDVPIESVSRMLGHSQAKTTQVYAEISPGRIFLDIEKVLP